MQISQQVYQEQLHFGEKTPTTVGLEQDEIKAGALGHQYRARRLQEKSDAVSDSTETASSCSTLSCRSADSGRESDNFDQACHLSSSSKHHVAAV